MNLPMHTYQYPVDFFLIPQINSVFKGWKMIMKLYIFRKFNQKQFNVEKNYNPFSLTSSSLASSNKLHNESDKTNKFRLCSSPSILCIIFVSFSLNIFSFINSSTRGSNRLRIGSILNLNKKQAWNW